MNCDRIDERLLSVTAAGPPPVFDDAELEHLGACPRCRELAAAAIAVHSAFANQPALPGPGPAYWGTVLSRVRSRIGERAEPWERWNAAIRSALMPAAAAAVIAILAVVAAVRTPDPGGIDAFATLSSLTDAELHELRLEGSTSGLLEAAEPAGSAEGTLADFIADIISEQGDSVLYAVAEPVDLLTHLDEERFAEVVSILENK